MNRYNLHKFLARANLTAHRIDGLVSFDYNKNITFEMDWDEISLNARGIVFEESTGKLVANAFPKFFNYEELNGDDARSIELVNKIPEKYHPNYDGESMILEKADGSCAITFWFNDRWYVKTRGSFVSDQAVWASAYLNNFIKTDEMNKSKTYIFEIIYPDNRIVVDYGDKEALVLIGVIDLETGDELWYDELKVEAEKIGSDIVKAFVFDKFEDIYTAREQLSVNEEGFVVTFKNGYKFKLKGEAYCNVHRKMCALTPLHFWRAFDVDNFIVPTEFLSELPEEFRDSVDILRVATERAHNDILDLVREYANNVPIFNDDNDGRKNRYLYLTENVPKEYIGLVLAYINGKMGSVHDVIHRKARPKNNSFPGVQLDDRVQRIVNES
jgi:RNA ligase